VIIDDIRPYIENLPCGSGLPGGAKFENVLDCFVDGCTSLKLLLHLDSLQYFALYSIKGFERQRGCLKLGARFSAKSLYHDDFVATGN